MSGLKLGSLTLESPFILAPLESVSDAPFRRLAHRLGAGFTWTEMIRARGLAGNNKSTLSLVDTFDAEVPTGVQLLATSGPELTDALGTLEALSKTTHPWFANIRAIDLNFGCPSPDVIRSGAGPAMLKRRGKLREIFEALRAAQRSTTLTLGFISAKIRLGLNRVEQDQKVFLPIVELANEHLDCLVVHGRHARQGSEAPALWSAISEVVRHAKVPVIGNGDVFSASDAERMLRETGAAGCLIARGAIRSPWIFRELSGQGAGLPTPSELDTAEAEYFQRAEASGSKPKFIEWHREGFRRLRARINGGAAQSNALPPNQHMS